MQKKDAQKLFQQLIQKRGYVGELFSINYESVKSLSGSQLGRYNCPFANS